MLSLICGTSEPGTPAVEVPDAAPEAGVRASVRPHRWRRAAALVATTCLVAAGVIAWQVSGPTHSPTSNARPPGFATYTDAAQHYRISYPRGWHRATDAEGGLVLHVRGQNAVGVREFDLRTAVDTHNLADMRSVTDAILSAPKARLTVLDSQQVRIGALTGLYYLYYFTADGQRGVHAHYFLFSGRRMFTLVFQALPVDGFASLAKTFDTVAASFAADPGRTR